MQDEIKEILETIDDLILIAPDKGHYAMSHKMWKQLLDYITNLQEENMKLIGENEAIKNVKYMVEETIYKSRIEKAIEYIQHELSHLKANDETSWNEEFYTNDKLDYKKLCIALLEQVVNKLKEKE